MRMVDDVLLGTLTADVERCKQYIGNHLEGGTARDLHANARHPPDVDAASHFGCRQASKAHGDEVDGMAACRQAPRYAVDHFCTTAAERRKLIGHLEYLHAIKPCNNRRRNEASRDYIRRAEMAAAARVTSGRVSHSARTAGC